MELPRLLTRKIDLRDHQQYAINHTSLVKKWKIIEENISAYIIINGVLIKPTKEFSFLDGKEFDMEKIRKIARDMIPYNNRTTNLCNMESSLFSSSLLAIEHYKYFDTKYLNNFAFTGDMCIYFKLYHTDPNLKNAGFPQRVSIEETYVLSDAQLEQRRRTGNEIGEKYVEENKE